MEPCLCSPLQMVGGCACTFLQVHMVAHPQNGNNSFRNCRLVFICYLLSVAGTKIAQSRAIQRFVAKYSGLYPYHDPVTTAHVDAVLDAVEDLSEALMKCTRGIDPKSPEYLEKRQECATTGTRS